MKVIELKLTPAQKTKLRKGMKIRINKKNRPVIEGEGIYMLVKPENYNVLTKTFDSSRGREFNLDAEELDVNQNPEAIQDEEVKEAIQGSGLFSRIRKGFKKVAKFYRNKVRDTPVGSAIRKAVKTGSKVAIKSAINALTGTPLAPLMPALKLANAKYGDKGINMAIEKLGLGMHAMVGQGLRAGRGMHGEGLRLGGEIDPVSEAIHEGETSVERAPGKEGGGRRAGEGMNGKGLRVRGNGSTVHRGSPIT